MVLMNGDCLDKLRQLEDNSVDSIVTDPPYGLGFMGKSWDTFDNSQFGKAGEEGENDLKVKKNFNILPRYNTDGLYDFTKDWAAECLRVLKPGGYILSFAGSRTYHKICMGIEDAGFEIRDQIMWVYGSGFPKSRNLGNGWGSALKPAHEPIVMARKPFKGSLTNNHNTYGTGGINIDGCRVVSDDNPMGWEQPQGGIWKTDSEATSKLVENTQGRFPANFIHDGLTEDWGRYFYCPKASKKDRNAGCDGMEEKEVVTFATANGTSGKASSLSEGRDTKYQNNHPTVKPQALMAYLCRLVTQPGGVVLDPFMGSGSTGRAALSEGFDFIGIEREPEYFAIAEARCG